MAHKQTTVYPIARTRVRVGDAQQTLLPGTSSADDLGLTSGTFATDSPTIQSSDLKAAGATTLFARVQMVLPPEYEAGQTVTIRISAGLITTVADVSATIDVEAHEIDRGGAVGADLVTTAALDINNPPRAAKAF